MSSSILNTTKKNLGIAEDYTAFDVDVMTHINGVFLILNQLGIGPAEGFTVTDATTTWEDFIGTNKKFQAIQPYMYLKVRLAFDPPQTSFAIDAMKELAEEYEWRLSVERERTEWVSPFPLKEPLLEPFGVPVIDGGSP